MPSDNRRAGGVRLWRVGLTVPDVDAAAAAMAALDGACDAVSTFEIEDDGAWRVEGLSAERPERARIEAALALVSPGEPPVLDIDRLAPHDWLARNQASFPPIAVGRYFIHGSHHREAVPAGRIGLLIDAATAFGTGEHATTRGCLAALAALARRRPPRRILDMGTGTGVLALAAAKSWHCRIDARDIDGEAVRVARQNAWRNGIAPLLDARRSAGYRDRALWRRAPFDLVLANILARPLAMMARDLAHALAPGGVAVLSGLLARQEPYVLAAHRAQRLRLERRIAIDGWHTLVLTRGGRAGVDIECPSASSESR
jgi:ribosomal protein L11 methyltransferase